MIWLIVAYILLEFISSFSVVNSVLGQNALETMDDGKPKSFNLYLVVPLLYEQDNLFDTYHRFQVFAETYDNVQVYFVTTERERIEKPDQISTREILNQIGGEFPSTKIKFLHYGENNNVVSEQLNFALTHIREEVSDLANSFVSFYNADSKISHRYIHVLSKTIGECLGQKVVFQQSSLFLTNVPELVADGKYLLAAFGVFQTSWTLRHEIPHYLFEKNILRVKCLSGFHLVYCVTHGLTLSLEAYNDLGPFPVMKIGGEDLAYGFRVKSCGYSVIPVLDLENSETPNNAIALYTQLKQWFLATLGYLTFWRHTGKEGRIFQNVLLTIQGILIHSVKWLIRGPFILFLLFKAIYYDRVVFFTLVYSMYVLATFLPVVCIWNRLDNNLFPNVSRMALIKLVIVYAMVPVLRSFPALTALFLYIRILFGYNFIKQKTGV